VLSSFRVFVIKYKIRHSYTAQKHEGQIPNFNFLISAFRGHLQNAIPRIYGNGVQDRGRGLFYTLNRHEWLH